MNPYRNSQLSMIASLCYVFEANVPRRMKIPVYWTKITNVATKHWVATKIIILNTATTTGFARVFLMNYYQCSIFHMAKMFQTLAEGVMGQGLHVTNCAAIDIAFCRD